MKEINTVELSKQAPGISHGLIAHLMVVTHFVVKSTLDQLTATNRYKKLSMTYERYIAVLVEGDHSPGELAAKVGSSKQACSKVIKELQKLGLIERRQNPEDGRSQLLFLSEHGQQLLQDGSRITTEVQQALTEKIGNERMQQMVVLLEQTCRGLGVEYHGYPALKQSGNETVQSQSTQLNILLQVLTNHIRQILLEEMTGKGFEGLRTNFGQILGMISREPRRIQDIAAVIGISKQAAAMMAIEFESLGYVIREEDPDDKRRIILSLSSNGEQLVHEAISSVRALEEKVQSQLGKEDYQQLEAILADLYDTVAYQLGTAHMLDMPNRVPERIRAITDSLLEELGAAGARTLAQHVLAITNS
ncbi:MarR family winged helix-turn-helix transcriptional regulator [Pseudomaricurvus sp.]|uniref:MarR family winged helix-turn-helix transcriptional regulator n=1 Tax=Pseudomaricurvus sp. TaxID=2004510 RepID=UPI003F6D45DB